MKQTNTHIVIPDTQCKPGTPYDHLLWIGQYINEQFNDKKVKIIHLGDHWDMPSLSSYDKGKKSMEGRRISADIQAGNDAFTYLDTAIGRNGRSRECYLLRGNHEARVSRAIESGAELDGLLTLDQLEAPKGWETIPFLEVLDLDGVLYSHYFYNPNTGRPYAGTNVDLRLKTIGQSFTMGHQQGLLWGRRELNNGRTQIGLVAGSCYLHDEDYKGPQANDHWRGIIICHNVENGDYDPMFVSLDYLCRRYTGRKLVDYRPKYIL